LTLIFSGRDYGLACDALSKKTERHGNKGAKGQECKTTTKGDLNVADKKPGWYEEIEQKFAAGISHTFIIHGDTGGYVEVGDNYVPLHFGISALLKGRQAVVFYNRSAGWRFRSAEEEQLIKTLLGNAVSGGGGGGLAGAVQQQQGAFPKDPVRSMPLFEKLLKTDRGAARLAIVIEYPESIFAAGKWDGAGANAELGALVVTLLRWAKDDEVAQQGHPIILICADDFESLHPSIRSPQARIEPIYIALPNLVQREEFINWYLNKKKTIKMNGVTARQLANATAGLSLLMIEDILLRSDRANGLDLSFVKDRKDEIIKAQFGDILEIQEPRHGWEAVGGQDHVVEFLTKHVINPLRTGNKQSAPMGVLMPGPPGTGKSIIAEALAKEAGVNFLAMHPGRLMGGIVGQTEKNTERVLRAIKGAAPCIVFIDEFDKAIPREDAYQGDSGVASRFLQRLQDFMSDTHHRGEIVFLGATNRPDRISAALKRAGRFDKKIPILPGDEKQREGVFKAVISKMNLHYNGKKLKDLALKTEGYVGADIEAIVVKACELADSQTITDSNLTEALDCMIPSVSKADIDFQTALAIKECNDLSQLPPRYRKMDKEAVNNLIGSYVERGDASGRTL
jgi:SpoVK/Ycf46/Vps4 family AAA+-type ATPase